MNFVVPAASLAALSMGMALSVTASARYGRRIAAFNLPAFAIYAAAIAISVAVASTPDDFATQVRFGLIVAGTAVAAITDMQTGLIYDAAMLPTLLLLFAAGAMHRQLPQCFGGTLAGAAALGSLYVFTRGRGIGLGDVKLGACMGAALGAAAGLTAIGIAFIAGGVAAVTLLASGRAFRKTEMRFAPYLALGTGWIVLWPPR